MPNLSEPYLAALRLLAQEHGYGPRELARRSNLPFSTVLHALRGDNPSCTLETAAALAKAVGTRLILQRGKVKLADSGLLRQRRVSEP